VLANRSVDLYNKVPDDREPAAVKDKGSGKGTRLNKLFRDELLEGRRIKVYGREG